MPPKKKRKKGEDAVEAAEAASGSGGSDDENASCVTSVVTFLTLLWAGLKVKTCCVCGCKSNEESPLSVIANDEDEHAGTLAWRSYTRHSRTEKHASGRLCLICWNVFRKLGHRIIMMCVCACVCR